jgi:hypothetical protein
MRAHYYLGGDENQGFVWVSWWWCQFPISSTQNVIREAETRTNFSSSTVADGEYGYAG